MLTIRSIMRMALVMGVLFGIPAYGAESQFGFVYTTDLLPKGEKEMEQWVTWRHSKNSGSFDLLEGRTAYEYGAADDIQVALYAIYDWTQAFHNGPFGATTPPEQFVYDQPGADEHYHSSRFVGASVEGIYRVLSPYIDPIGMAFYMEPTIGPKFLELESKIILQKNYLDDTLTLGFNFTYAPEFRLVPASITDSTSNAGWQEETDVNFYLGASYRFISNWSAGFEFLNEREFNNLGFVQESNSGFYLGPSIHFGGKSFFATLVFLRQMPWATSHSDTVPGTLDGGYVGDNDFEKNRLRLKVGFYF